VKPPFEVTGLYRVPGEQTMRFTIDIDIKSDTDLEVIVAEFHRLLPVLEAIKPLADW
jgi:hypothetical protein